MAAQPPPYSQPGGYAAPSPTPPPRRSRAGWYIGGGIVALLLLCCLGVVIFSALLGGGVFALFRVTAGPRDATTGYFQAVENGDWVAAQGYLSSSLRSRTTPAELQAQWTRRTATTGPVAGFTVTSTNITSNTATVGGTLHYQGGTSATVTVNLVDEGGDWKISSLP